MGAEYNGAMAPPSPHSASASVLRERLRGGSPLLLDGAMGTELERRGITSTLPLWSTHALLEAPGIVREIHSDYVAAGAEIVTANTFRTQRRTLERAGIAERARELSTHAVALAREAVAGHASPCWVAGSAPTLEDCYRPDLVPDAESLEREHGEHASALAQAGIDLILVETINCAREGVAAARAARATGLPFCVSFVCDERARLLSGERLAAALDAVCALEPDAIAVNCLPPAAVLGCLPKLAERAIPFGVWANLGSPSADGFTRSDDCPPERFAELAGVWLDAGARIVGGCCGTTPDHIRAIFERRAAMESGSR